MLDFDPRDFDSRDRDDDRRPDLGRGGHTPDNPRVPERATRDLRDIAIRHVDLPRGPRREPVRVRDRAYEINGSQSRVLATVGAFRVVSSTSRPLSAVPATHALPTSGISERVGSFRRHRYRVTRTVS